MLKMPIPSIFPCAPTPSAHVRREIERRVGKTQVRETRHMHDAWFVLIQVESLVHVLEVVWRGRNVVLQYDDAVVFLEYLCNALCDIALELDVLGSGN